VGQAGIPLEVLYEKTQSLYKLVVLVARRATQLNAGGAALVQQTHIDVIGTALQEVADDKITWKKSDPKKSE
jgi:DNA-directed RNA polymerase omega subunit